MYIKVVAPQLTLANDDNEYEGTTYLEVQHVREIYGAHIGSQDGKDRHYHVDYDKVSYFYAKSRGIKPDEQLNLTIYEKGKGILQAKNVHADKSGMIKIQLEWNLLNPKTAMRIVYAVVKDKDQNILYNGAKVATGPLVITKKSAILKLAEYKSAVMVGKGSGGSGGVKDNKYGVCESEARVRAFMRMLRVKEGTQNERGYTTQFSGKQFSNMNTHPREVITASGHASSAAGAYQIMTDTFDGLKSYRDKYKITDFSQESQDKLCLVILKYSYATDRYDSFYSPIYYKDKNKTIRDTAKEITAKEWRKRFKNQQADIIQLIIDNDIKRAALLASLCWSSLPDSPYGQQSADYTFEDVKSIYDKYLAEELKAPSAELHLKKGFLKEFKYPCCEDSKDSASDNGKWRMPIYNSMLCLYSQGGVKKPWHGSFGDKIRDGVVTHTGNDLLAEPGTKVYACVNSKVNRIYTSATMAGNVVVLEVVDNETFKKLRNKTYAPKYKDKGEILEKSFDHEGVIYLTFWHLSKNNYFKVGDEVKYNDVIGLTGVSGWNGNNFTTRNPHLHFEISNVGSAVGLEGKCNPSVYFKFKTEDELSESEIEYQNKLKEKEWN